MNPDLTRKSPEPAVRMSRGLQWSLWLRSLSLQASWNHQRMQNLGLLWNVLPWLRRTKRHINRDRLFCRRYYGFFNTNPYLANFLIGGLIRLEEDLADRPAAESEFIGTFRDSVGRALASLGDQLFWLGIRPTLIMLICFSGLLGQVSSILIILGIFTAFQLVLRWLALQRGYELGMDIVDLLFDKRWHLWIARTKRAGMVLTGMVIGLYLAQVADTGVSPGRGMLWIGTGLGIGLPVVLRKRLPGEAMIPAALILALLLTFAI